MNQINSFHELENYQPQAAKMLHHGFKENRLSHAYIFEGPKGTHKRATAFLFAARLLCQQPNENDEPCGVCANCHRIQHGMHPNVFLIEADGEQIKKDQIKQLINEFSKMALEDGPRIYIIDEAHRMNQDASNTLLKQMEEPSQSIYAILLTTNANALLKTILSRAQIIHFKPISRKKIHDELIHDGVDELRASLIPEYTNNIEEASKIAQSKDLMPLLDLVIQLYALLETKESSLIIRFREMADKVMASSTNMDFFLTMMILYQKDILNYQLRHHQTINYSTELKTITWLASHVSQKTVQEMLETMLTLKLRFRYNLNFNLVWDELIAQLERKMH